MKRRLTHGVHEDRVVQEAFEELWFRPLEALVVFWWYSPQRERSEVLSKDYSHLCGSFVLRDSELVGDDGELIVGASPENVALSFRPLFVIDLLVLDPEVDDLLGQTNPGIVWRWW